MSVRLESLGGRCREHVQFDHNPFRTCREHSSFRLSFAQGTLCMSIVALEHCEVALAPTGTARLMTACALGLKLVEAS